MPSAYAHDRFGEEVLSSLPEDLAATVEKYRNLFSIGLQGPDPFYYYNPLKKNDMDAFAEVLHRMAGLYFFKRTPVLSEAELVYMAGFVCHFTLDASCHWYVTQYMTAKGVTHEEIEGEFDRFLLVRNGVDPVRAVKTRHFHPENASARVITGLFTRFCEENGDAAPSPGLSSTKVTEPKVLKSLRGFVRFESILRCPTDLKRNVLYWLLRRVGKYDALKGHITNKQEDPACQESSRGLFSLYTQAVPDAAALVSAWFRKDSVNFEQNSLLKYNFLGEKVIMDEED